MTVDFAEPIGATFSFRQTRDLAWELAFTGSGWWARSPAGATFDVSCPWWATPLLRWLMHSHWPALLEASAIHDEILRQGWSWRPAAAVFADVLAARGVTRWRVEVLFVIVGVRGRRATDAPSESAIHGLEADG